MNGIKIFSAVILIFSIGLCIFSACKKDEPTQQTSDTSTQADTTAYNGYSYAEDIFTEELQTQYVHIVPPVPSKSVHRTEKTTAKTTADTTTATKTVQSDKVDEIINGINILSKTSPVIKGNSASIIITGTPNAEYTIEFYETADKKATYSGLGTAKADSNGIASWSFAVESSCESGERKIIIREKNSDKYIQTSITVL